MDSLDFLVILSIFIGLLISAHFLRPKLLNMDFQYSISNGQELRKTKKKTNHLLHTHNEQSFSNNILITQSEYSYYLLNLLADIRDPNVKKMVIFIQRRFPVSLKPIKIKEFHENIEEDGEEDKQKNTPHKKFGSRNVVILPSFHISTEKALSEKYQFITLYGSRVVTLLLRAENDNKMVIQNEYKNLSPQRKTKPKRRAFSIVGLPSQNYTGQKRSSHQLARIPKKNKLDNLRVAVLENSSDEDFLEKINDILKLNFQILRFSTLNDIKMSWENVDMNIDALFLLTSHKNQFVEDFCSLYRVVFFNFVSYLERSPELVTLMKFQFPLLQRTELNISDYRSLNTIQVIPSLKIFTAVLATEDVADDSVIRFLQFLTTSFLDAKSNVPECNTFIASEMHMAPPEIDLHPGSRKFFQSKGKIYVGIQNENDVKLCSHINGLCTDKMKTIVSQIRKRSSMND